MARESLASKSVKKSPLLCGYSSHSIQNYTGLHLVKIFLLFSFMSEIFFLPFTSLIDREDKLNPDFYMVTAVSKVMVV